MSRTPDSEIPGKFGVRTDPSDGNGYRYRAIEDAADYWGTNKSEAVALSCDVTGRLLRNLAEALEHEDLPESLARDLAEQISTADVKVNVEGRSVSVDRD